jgi:hypothetical protein
MKKVERKLPIKGGGGMNIEKRNVREMKKRQAQDNGEREGWRQLKRYGGLYPIASDRCTPTGSWGR